MNKRQRKKQDKKITALLLRTAENYKPALKVLAKIMFGKEDSK